MHAREFFNLLLKLLVDRQLLQKVPCLLYQVRFSVLAQKREELIVVLLFLRDQKFRMLIRDVSFVKLNDNLLDQTLVPHVAVIILIRVNKCILDDHVELVNLVTESIGNLDPQVADCLEVANLDWLLEHFRSLNDRQLHRLEV